MQKYDLNELWALFMERKLKRAEFEGLVYQYYVKNKEKTQISNWKDEDYEDFISWFYPRLRKVIDLYKDSGSSFESYLSAIFFTASREYYIRKVTKSVTEYSAWSAQVPDLYAREEAPSYSVEQQEKALSDILIENRGRKNPKQMLMLILKCYYYVSDDFIDRVACHTGIDRKKLKEMIEKLRKAREERDDRIYKMKERIYCQFYRCIVYEKRLSYIPENSNAYIVLKAKLEKARSRLEKMRNRISGVRTDATNREVANVIGVSKGAVDSSLYNLKSKWNIILKKEMLN
jgi:hypothetical protein